MNRFQIVLTACVFTAAAAWGQAANSSTPQSAQPGASAQTTPQAQPAQPAQAGQTAQSGNSAATSAKNEISGCMTRGFANYQLSDSSTQTSYQIRGNGADFAQHENKVVQIQGVTDPQASQGGKTIFYANTVKDTGQSCGNPTQMAANSAPGQAGAQPQNATQPQPAGTSSTSAQTQPGADAASSSQRAQNAPLSGVSNSQQSSSSATPNAQAGSSTGAIGAGQSSGNASTNSNTSQAAGSADSPAASTNSMSNNSQSTADSQQGGTAGAATQSQSETGEDKGTPQAGTPQNGAVGSPAGSSSSAAGATSSQSAAQTFQGCVSGDPNNLKFNSNGKDYHLQGDTRSVWKLIGHQVEVTGEDFGGKAIQISGDAKDLGSCKK